jgi:hypothetical protein
MISGCLAYRFPVLWHFPEYLHLLFTGMPFSLSHFLISLGLWQATLLACPVFGKFSLGRTFRRQQVKNSCPQVAP